MHKTPPANLPQGFRDIWKAVAEVDEAAASRQVLAKELGVSTNTLQRILVDGGVPDFTASVSRRILHSWTRIVTKLALYFGKDPFEWVKMVEITVSDRIQEVINSEISKRTIANPATDPRTRTTSATTHPDCDSAFFESLGRKMLKSIAPELKAKILLKDDLVQGIETAPEKSKTIRKTPSSNDERRENYCLSCLALLEDERNAGASDVYCRHCSDENGALLPREEVLEIIAEWFQNWQKDLTASEARRRADLYMRSMPAWNQVTPSPE